MSFCAAHAYVRTYLTFTPLVRTLLLLAVAVAVVLFFAADLDYNSSEKYRSTSTKKTT